jgi:hypothetical protein
MSSLRESLARALAGAAIVVFSGPWVATAQTVFINEIHYDNAGTDAGELSRSRDRRAPTSPAGVWFSTTATAARCMTPMR